MDRLKGYFLAFLKQGLTPEKLAWCVALGVGLGLFPVIGVTTLLCGAAAHLAKLNHPAIQSINMAMYPVQLVLLIPWFKLGAFLFRHKDMNVTLSQVVSEFAHGVPHAIAALWTVTMHAIVAWCLVAPVGIMLSYWVLRAAFRKLAWEVGPQ